MSCHLIPTCHEWNANADDVMMMWFSLYANLVTLYLACVTCMHMHGAHSLCKTSVSKYLRGLACMQDMHGAHSLCKTSMSKYLSGLVCM